MQDKFGSRTCIPVRLPLIYFHSNIKNDHLGAGGQGRRGMGNNHPMRQQRVIKFPMDTDQGGRLFMTPVQ
jgi:hypothetical protein